MRALDYAMALLLAGRTVRRDRGGRPRRRPRTRPTLGSPSLLAVTRLTALAASGLSSEATDTSPSSTRSTATSPIPPPRFPHVEPADPAGPRAERSGTGRAVAPAPGPASGTGRLRRVGPALRSWLLLERGESCRRVGRGPTACTRRSERLDLRPHLAAFDALLSKAAAPSSWRCGPTTSPPRSTRSTRTPTRSISRSSCSVSGRCGWRAGAHGGLAGGTGADTDARPRTSSRSAAAAGHPPRRAVRPRAAQLRSGRRRSPDPRSAATGGPAEPADRPQPAVAGRRDDVEAALPVTTTGRCPAPRGPPAPRPGQTGAPRRRDDVASARARPRERRARTVRARGSASAAAARRSAGRRAVPRPGRGSSARSTPRRPSRPVDIVEPLTPKELEVLARLPSHATYRAIGAQLYVSVNTVKTYVRSDLPQAGRVVASRGRRGRAAVWPARRVTCL
jgi:DNA-binding CsgD family transcriptional regulator